MYSLLLVDDEKLTLDALYSAVDWNQLGISVIHTAKNGQEALQKAKVLNPDIIITDVQMPVMNGIEFTNNLRKQKVRSKIIFLSGYDEFEYVKNAITVNATDYLLKPVNIEELENVVHKAITECVQDHLKARSNVALLEQLVIELLYEKEEPTRIQLCEEIYQLQEIDVNKALHSLLLFKLDKDTNPSIHKITDLLKDELNNESIPFLVVQPSYDEFALIVTRRKNKVFDEELLCKRIQDEMRKLTQGSVTCCLPSQLATFQALGDLYYKALQLLEYRFYLGEQNIITPMAIQPFQRSTSITASYMDGVVERVLAKIEDEDIKQFLSQQFQILITEGKKKWEIQEFCYQFIQRTIGNIESNDDKLTPSDYWEKINSLPTIKKLEGYMIELFSDWTHYRSQKATNPNQQRIEKILHIVHTNFHREITIYTIADQLYLSPNYIRAIFKEETGETLLTYLTKVRIEKATRYLQNHSLKIREVAHKVGYQNVSYFCSLFHKIKGLSPGEYRNYFYRINEYESV